MTKPRQGGLYRVLIIDDEWPTREPAYKATLGELCELVFVRSPDALKKHVGTEYDAYVLDVVLNQREWSTNAEDVLQTLGAATGEMSGPVILVTRMWESERGDLLSRQFSAALKPKSPVRLVLPWRAFAPEDVGDAYRSEILESTRGQVLVEIKRWHRLADFQINPGAPIRILHLANLEFGHPRCSSLFPADPSEVARELRAIRMGPDLVIVSGNVSYSGRPSEFAQAREWLESLCEDFWSARFLNERVFVAPGRHDVNRVLASADQYEYSPALGGLVRREASAGAAELHGFGLAPFRGFADGLVAGERWSRGGGDAEAIVEHRYRRFGLRIVGFSEGTSMGRSPVGDLLVERLRTAVGALPEEPDAVHVVVAERGAALASEGALSDARGACLVLAGDGDAWGAEADNRSVGVFVATGRRGGREEAAPRGFNLIEVDAFNDRTIRVTTFTCEDGHIAALDEPREFRVPLTRSTPGERGGEGAGPAAEARVLRMDDLSELKVSLAQLYNTDAMTRGVASDAGIDVTNLPMTGSVRDVWHSILEEATKTGRVRAIIQQALKRFATNPHLLAVVKELDPTLMPSR